MRKIKSSIALLSLALLLGGGAVHAQELLLDIPANQSQELKYTYSLRGGEDSEMQKIAELTDKLLKKAALGIESQAGSVPSDLVDVICEFTSKNEIKLLDKTIKFRGEREAARLLAKELKRYFTTGNLPYVSTVFESGKEGYAEYRIPSAIALPSGRVIAFIEARAFHHSDNAENKIVIKYSDDMAKSWSAPILVRDEGEYSLNNPCAVYVKESDEIVLLYQLFPPKTSEVSSLAGNDGKNVLRVFKVVSKDQGESWSEPEDITAQLKHPKASVVCSGPGVAIRLQEGDFKGRIVVPFNALTDDNKWYNYLGYSDDLGKTWGILPGESNYGTNESQVVEVAPNELAIYARCHQFQGVNTKETPEGWSAWNFDRVTRNRARIAVSLKSDGRVEWHPTEVVESLPDPLCQGSAITLRSDSKPVRLLISNPASKYTTQVNQRGFAGTPASRINGTTRLSYDGGETWSYSKRVYGDRLTSFGYSVLVDLGDGNLGTIFESHGIIRFVKYDLEWLTSGEDMGEDL